ncbi:MAG: HYR domain-containing protein, partial [Saprospiraceae bacterium]|nr:HYR domain-containing protein [Saprospiraceae bacterium]
ATDQANNTRTCSFTVTVNDTQKPVITCPANIVRNNDPGKCYAVVTYPNATATDNCSATVTLLSGLASGSQFPVGTSTIEFQAKDPSDNTSTCSFTIRVNDVEPPVVTCPPALNLPNDPGQCSRQINWVGQATYTDNCGASYNQSNSPGFFPVGEHTVVHTVIDYSGNSATCVQNVTVYDQEYPGIYCPQNMVVKTDEFDCVATVSYSASGYDNCPGYSITYSTDSPAAFEAGYNNVTATITDGAGNSTSCTFQIRVDNRQEICNDFDDDCDGLVDESEGWEKVAKVLAVDGSSQAQYGLSVDIHKGYAIVGSNKKTPGGQPLGAAYILIRTPNGWTQMAKLLPADVEPDDLFGASVAIHGNIAAVGAPSDDDPVGNEGAVYVFYRTPANVWNLIKKVKASDADPADNFGISVDLDGERLLVGANHDDEKGANAGAAYVFYQNQGGNDNWGQVAKLVGNTSTDGDNMGVSVSIDGDHALVGATGVDNLIQNTGGAFVFGRNVGGADAWGEVTKILAPSASQNDNFGGSVGISGNYAIIGADQNDQKGLDAGAAYIFFRNENNQADSWGLSRILRDYNGSAGKRFGSGVGIDGDYAVVGSQGDSPFGAGSGRGFLYLRLEDNWIQVDELTDGAGQAADNLGTTAAISGTIVILGAPLDDIGADVNEGSVVIFEGLCVENNERPTERNADEILADASLRCFPVPFQDVLHVEINDIVAANVQVTVINALGQEVANLFQGAIDGQMRFQWRPSANMAQGYYFLRLRADGKIITKPLVLTR